MYLFHLIDFLRSSSCHILCYRGNLLQSVRSFPFWARPPFVPMNMHDFTSCVKLFRVVCWMFTILQLIISFFSPTPFDVVSASETVSVVTEFSPLWFPLPDVVISTDAIPNHWAFYFQGSGLPLSCSGAQSGSMHRAHTALQEC